MTTEERLEKLERKIEEMQTVIRTTKLCIVDNKGRYRARLGMNNGKPELVMKDANGESRAVMFVDKEGPRMDMKDANGKSRVVMAVEKVGPWLGILDANEKTIWKAQLRQSPWPAVSKEGRKVTAL